MKMVSDCQKIGKKEGVEGSYRVRLSLGGFGGGWPASNNAGWVISCGILVAPSEFVELPCVAFFSPVTVTTPSLEMVNTIKSPGFTPRTSSKLFLGLNTWAKR